MGSQVGRQRASRLKERGDIMLTGILIGLGILLASALMTVIVAEVLELIIHLVDYWWDRLL